MFTDQNLVQRKKAPAYNQISHVENEHQGTTTIAYIFL